MRPFQGQGPRIPERKERVNDRIRAKEIRVIDDQGNQLGVMLPQQALDLARERGYDLVEVSPTAVPPVCRIMDYGQFLYERKKKEHSAKKKQKQFKVKEIKFRPKTDEHDFQFKLKNITRFLSEGDKVKATIIFRGRENFHQDIGFRILERLRKELLETGIIEVPPRKEGSLLHMIIAPKKTQGAPAPKREDKREEK
jgi:translation initiation factor IF-3